MQYVVALIPMVVTGSVVIGVVVWLFRSQLPKKDAEDREADEARERRTGRSGSGVKPENAGE